MPEKPVRDSIAERYPLLAERWDHERNHFRLEDIYSLSRDDKYYWKCSNGLPHSYLALSGKLIIGRGCGICVGRQVLLGFNDLAFKFPDIASEWHPIKNGSLTPQEVTAGSGKKAWWLGSCNHEWEVAVDSRTSQGNGCPFCSGQKVLTGFNDLSTTHPDIAAEWHSVLNGAKLPTKVSYGHRNKIWWQDKLGHEWDMSVLHRTNQKQGCPFCAGKRVLAGFNDLSTHSLSIASEWHPVKNGSLTPQEVTAGSGKKAWWFGSCNHEWVAAISRRAKANPTGCPVCSGVQVLSGFNDLAFKRPDIASEWHPLLNGSLTPQEVTAGTNIKVWWLGICGHNWECRVAGRTALSTGTGCPVCANKIILLGFNDLAFKFPDIASEWHPIKNGSLTPQGVIAGTNIKVWWLGNCNHEWEAAVNSRTSRGDGCSVCAGKTVLKGFNDLASQFSSIAAEWSGRNNKNSDDVTFGSNSKVIWECALKHEWEATVSSRTSQKSTGCPVCANQTVISGFNDLAFKFPDIAAEWSDRNTNKPHEVAFGSNSKVIWECALKHEWEAVIVSRTRRGTGCSKCSLVGSSKIERRLFEGFKLSFPDAQSGLRLPIVFNKVKSLSVDILFSAENNRKIVVEFDGAYYHDGRRSGKGLPWHLEYDGMKTEALLAAGYTVVRIRGDKLPHLQLSDPNLFQISHAEVKGNISATVAAILVFLNSLPVS